MEASAERKWIEVQGLRISYLEAGNAGSPVLLLHGGGLDSASLTYRFSIAPISQSHRAFAPDWPGYGESDKPKVNYSTPYYVGFLDSLVDALGLTRPSLVGISMGGGAALGFTLKSPEKVHRLVLVDSYGLGGEIPWRTLSYALVRLPLANELTWAALGWSPRLTRRSLRSIIYEPRAITDDLVDEVHRMVKQPGAGSAFRSFQRNEVGWGGLCTNYVHEFHKIRAPTLIIHGGEDRLVPVAWARRAHALIQNSQLCVLPGCGHWPPRERPDEFNRTVVEFLARG